MRFLQNPGSKLKLGFNKTGQVKVQTFPILYASDFFSFRLLVFRFKNTATLNLYNLFMFLL